MMKNKPSSTPTNRQKSSRLANHQGKPQRLFNKMIISGFTLSALVLGGIASAPLLNKGPQPGERIKGRKDYLSEYVILVDNSDSFTTLQNQLLDQHLLVKLPSQLKRGDAVTIIFLTADANDPTHFVYHNEVPNLGNGMDRVTLDAEDLQQLEQEKWDSFFEEYKNSISFARQIEPKRYSPLYEGLRGVDTYLNESDADKKHVLIVSDFLQHTRSCSDYNISKTCQPPDLEWSNIEVTALYMNRFNDANHQTVDHKSRTKTLFENAAPGVVTWREW